MKYFERSKTTQWRPKRGSMFRLTIPLFMCSHWMSGGLRKRIHLVVLGFQPVELYPRTPIPNTYARTRYLGFPPSSWDSSLVNIDWGIWLAGPLRMGDDTFLLAAT